MEAFFKNFLVVIVLIGGLTRLSNFFLNKKVDKAYICTFAIFFVVVLPIVSVTLGFDVAIAIYLICLLLWFLLDYLHAQVKDKK